MIYIPKNKYRPRYFSPLGWIAVTTVCLLAVVYLIGLAWLMAAFK